VISLTRKNETPAQGRGRQSRRKLFRSWWRRRWLRRRTLLRGCGRSCRLARGALENRSANAARVSRRHDRKRERSQHENDYSAGRRTRESGCSATRSEGALAAGSAECSGEIGVLAALQQHNDDEKNADNDVDCSENVDHFVGGSVSGSGLPAFQ
jgi:hypothetical protein